MYSTHSFPFFGRRHHRDQRGGEPMEFARGRGGHGHRHGRGHGRGRHGGGPGGQFGGGMFGGGRGFDGGFFRRGVRARRGDVRSAILVLLAEEPRNGYQLMQAIEQRSDGAWRPSPGSMYPALQQLQDEGLVRVEESASGRVFHLTAEGSKQATAQQQEPPPWDPAVIGESQEEVGEFREIFHQVMLAAMQVGRAGTATQRAEARKVLTDARRSLYRILAEDEE